MVMHLRGNFGRHHSAYLGLEKRGGWEEEDVASPRQQGRGEVSSYCRCVKQGEASAFREEPKRADGSVLANNDGYILRTLGKISRQGTLATMHMGRYLARKYLRLDHRAGANRKMDGMPAQPSAAAYPQMQLHHRSLQIYVPTTAKVCIQLYMIRTCTRIPVKCPR